MSRTAEITLSLIMIALSAAALLFWLPNDVDTGLVYTHRRQTYLGDLLIPAISVAAILLLSLIQLGLTLRLKKAADERFSFDWSLARFWLAVTAIMVAGCLLMYWAGPLAVSWFAARADGTAETYRNLRGTMPWNLIGFVLGGMTILMGLSIVIEGRFRPVRVLSSAIAILVLILIFQGPIDNMLLPPNGDW